MSQRSDQLDASDPVQPDPERQQRPDRAASVPDPRLMLSDRGGCLPAIEPALSEGASLRKLTFYS
jgi:hypothetical protein